MDGYFTCVILRLLSWQPTHVYLFLWTHVLFVEENVVWSALGNGQCRWITVWDYHITLVHNGQGIKRSISLYVQFTSCIQSPFALSHRYADDGIISDQNYPAVPIRNVSPRFCIGIQMSTRIILFLCARFTRTTIGSCFHESLCHSFSTHSNIRGLISGRKWAKGNNKDL